MSIESRFKPIIIQKKPIDSFSGVSYEFKEVTSGFIQPVSSGETFSQVKAGEKVSHRLYTTLSCGAVYGDRVQWNGVYYVVVSADQPDGISSVGHHKEILIQQVLG